MKVLVPVKRVIDYNVKVRVKADGSGVDLANVKMSMNPFDEISVEEAIRLKEKGKATEVIVVSIGPQQATETIRTALAMGADRGILVKTDGEVEPLAVAKILKAICEAEQPGLVILASRPSTTIPTRPARCWRRFWAGRRRPSRTSSRWAKASRVEREIDGGLQTVEIKLPAIVTTDLRLNEPRYASLPNIMKAKKKPIDEKKPGRLWRRCHAAPEGAEGDRAAQAPGRHQGEDGRRTGGQAQRSGGDLMASLVIAEHDNKTLKDATAKTVTAAAQVSAPVHVLVAGSDCACCRRTGRRNSPGVREGAGGRRPAYAKLVAEPMETLILSLADKYDAILAPATTNGKNYMPRVAAKLDVPQISEILKVVSPDTFERPIYAGNAIATVQAPEGKKIITVRTTAFKAAAQDGSAAVENVTAAGRPGHLEIRRRGTFQVRAARIDHRQDRDLGRARHAIRRQFSSAWRRSPTSCTPPSAPAARRWMRVSCPTTIRSGQTGKVVAPELYIAVGISGAIQHLAGMKDSKVIAAINKDEEAPIFQVADFGLVADLFKALPEMEEELTKLGY